MTHSDLAVASQGACSRLLPLGAVDELRLRDCGSLVRAQKRPRLSKGKHEVLLGVEDEGIAP